jgi:hypothetical protein
MHGSENVKHMGCVDDMKGFIDVSAGGTYDYRRVLKL